MQIIGWTKFCTETVLPYTQESADGIPGVCITRRGNAFAYYNIKGAQYEMFFFCIPVCYVAHSIFLSAETPVSPLRTKRFKLLRAYRHFAKKMKNCKQHHKKWCFFGELPAFCFHGLAGDRIPVAVAQKGLNALCGILMSDLEMCLLFYSITVVWDADSLLGTCLNAWEHSFGGGLCAPRAIFRPTVPRKN